MSHKLFITTIFALLLSHGQLSADIRFTDISDSSGISDPGLDGAGVAFADYDNDGDIDVYVSNADSGAIESDVHNRLWENDGTGKFQDVSKARGVDNFGGLGRGVSWGDYDNDGDKDLLVGNMQSSRASDTTPPSTLYKNMLSETGSANFINVTREAGFMRQGNEADAKAGGPSDTSGGIAWADYNNDGLLDILWRTTDYDIDHALFKNNGDGTFSDRTVKTGVTLVGKIDKMNLQGAGGWFDMDQDGDLDLLVSVEGDSNVLLLNNGDETFQDITRSMKPPSGLAFLNNGNANGVCLGDVDNDGDTDAFFPLADQANRLVKNELAETGKVSFTDITLSSGVGDLGGARGCTMADYDNDGYLDIYTNNGGLSRHLANDILEGLPVFVQFYIAYEDAPNVLMRNNGDNTFTDVTEQSGAISDGVGIGVASGDVNDDGFPDLFVANKTYHKDGETLSGINQNYLYLNSGTDNNWLKVTLKRGSDRRSILNTRVRAYAGDIVVTREVFSSTGYNSVDDPDLIFGIGQREAIDKLEVTWPNGDTEVFETIPINERVVIEEGQSELQ